MNELLIRIRCPAHLVSDPLSPGASLPCPVQMELQVVACNLCAVELASRGTLAIFNTCTLVALFRQLCRHQGIARFVKVGTGISVHYIGDLKYLLFLEEQNKFISLHKTTSLPQNTMCNPFACLSRRPHQKSPKKHCSKEEQEAYHTSVTGPLLDPKDWPSGSLLSHLHYRLRTNRLSQKPTKRRTRGPGRKRDGKRSGQNG